MFVVGSIGLTLRIGQVATLGRRTLVTAFASALVSAVSAFILIWFLGLSGGDS